MEMGIAPLIMKPLQALTICCSLTLNASTGGHNNGFIELEIEIAVMLLMPFNQEQTKRERCN